MTINQRDQATELFLRAQGYDHDLVTEAISVLSGGTREELTADAPLLTPKELCAALRISSTTLWRMKVPCHVVVGARRRYDRREVEDFLAKRRIAHKGSKGIACAY